jgi:hypothetical protein
MIGSSSREVVVSVDGYGVRSLLATNTSGHPMIFKNEQDQDDFQFLYFTIIYHSNYFGSLEPAKAFRETLKLQLSFIGCLSFST